MSKKQGVPLFILIAGVLVLLLWIAKPPREPVYQGKPLSSWLEDLEHWDGDTNNRAFVAFQEMGTNAIPALLVAIQSDISPFQRMMLELNRKQSFVKFPIGTSWNQTMAATWGLYAMGTNAEHALPVLTNLLYRNDVSIPSATALAGIGLKGVPPLLAALTNGDDRIRYSAALGLGWERSDFEVVVPALIARLQDDNRVQNKAIISLRRLHVMPELVVPALTNAFTNNDALVRSLVLVSLSQFGTGAKRSVPMVMTALKDSDESVRSSAAFALKKIDPEAAEKAGVK